MEKIAKAEKIAKRYLGEEPIHGFPHIKRVQKHFNKTLKQNITLNNKSKSKIIKALKWAVVLHDIGNLCGREKHGANSVKILDEYYKSFKIPQEELVKYAIIYHSDPQKNKKPPNHPKTNKDLCLSFLMILDHMDAFGKVGTCRAIKYLKEKQSKKYFKWIPCNKKFNFIKKNIDDFFCRTVKICKEDKDSSVLEHLLFNYYYIDENFNRVKNKLNKNFYNKYKNLKKEHKERIIELIKGKKIALKKLRCPGKLSIK